MSDQWIEYEIKVVAKARLFSRENVSVEESLEFANEMMREGTLPFEVVVEAVG